MIDERIIHITEEDEYWDQVLGRTAEIPTPISLRGRVIVISIIRYLTFNSYIIF